MGVISRQRQKKLIQEIVFNGKTVKDAAVIAGYPGKPETARVEAARDLKKPHVRAAFEAALDKAGCSVDATAQVVADAHKADKLQSINFETHKVADHPTRLRAAEIAAKMRGLETEAPVGAQINIGVLIGMVRQQREQRGLSI